MKQVHGAGFKIVFWLCFSSFVHFQYFLMLKKCNMKKVQRSRGVVGTSRTSKTGSFPTIFNGFALLIVFAKLSILDVCGDPGYTFGNSETWTNRISQIDVFLGKGVLQICSKFTGKHPCQNVISIKLLCNFIDITL